MVLDEAERERQILDRILGLKQRLKDNRGGPVELHELAICYFHLNNFQIAADRLAELCENFPDYVEIAAAYALRILSLIHADEPLEAERLLRQRMERFPSDLRLLSMLAHVEMMKRKYVRSIELHRRILQLDPDNLNSLNSLGYLLAIHGSPQEQQEAFAHLSKAVARKPDHSAYLDSLGVYYTRNGDARRARQALERALQRSPESGEILDHYKAVHCPPSKS
ncbi:MAG: tetratricopeptide repeat protein [Leptospirales bacterium]|nr:tetratricopeptide repeat protein [Leptospirales bacterium]